MKIAWYINVIGLIFSIIGFTQMGSDTFNILLFIGLTIQTIAVIIYWIFKYKTKKFKS